MYNHIPLGSSEKFNVIIEIPEGTSNKYEYDEKLDAITLDFIFIDAPYPHNYGFLPETRAEDGDHLDALVVNPYPLMTGTVVPCRAIGMIELLDRGEKDNKIIAVPAVATPAKLPVSLQDISEEHRLQLKNFFEKLAKQKNKTTEILAFHDRERAMQEIQTMHQKYLEHLPKQ